MSKQSNKIENSYMEPRITMKSNFYKHTVVNNIIDQDTAAKGTAILDKAKQGSIQMFVRAIEEEAMADESDDQADCGPSEVSDSSEESGM